MGKRDDGLHFVDAYSDWEDAQDRYRDERAVRFRESLLQQSGLTPDDVGTELEEEVGDVDVSFVFGTATEALDAYKYASSLGLADDLFYEDSDGFDLRLSGEMDLDKADALIEFMGAASRIIEDDMGDEFSSWLGSIVEVTDRQKKGIAKLKEKKKKKMQMPKEYNALHGAKDGTFSTRKAIKSAGKGSYSHLGTKRKAGKAKKGQFQFQMTKNPCGREARDVGRTTRCHDGKSGYPWPSSKVRSR